MVVLKDVKKVYKSEGGVSFEALSGISLKIEDGEMVAIVGTSGAGKSTLLHILAGIDKYDEGEYCLDDMLIKKISDGKMAAIRNKKIGIVMQNYDLVEDFTVLQNVILPLDFAKGKKLDKKKKREEALNALESVGMSEFAKKRVYRLSGGQKQRVAIARAIVNEPSIVLADEPTGAIDSHNSLEIMKLFKELNEKGRTIIIVTHDKEVAECANRIINLEDGLIVKDSAEE